MIVKPNQKLYILGVQVSPWLVAEVSEWGAVGIYKPTGNPQAEGRLGMLKGKMKLNAASNLFKVGLRIIPHMICEIEYSIKVFVGICLTNPRGGGRMGTTLKNR